MLLLLTYDVMFVPPSVAVLYIIITAERFVKTTSRKASLVLPSDQYHCKELSIRVHLYCLLEESKKINLLLMHIVLHGC